ncbi:MAG: prepilin-type N-terminal cleavage/methylation domain-containing protein [Synergistaceae bacterium]|jgi:general secretion pathway protein G|nr:prepilin-type N-terminal cleavage/methylation domain-containing protein [Synergistaceae bacterium]
MKTSEGGFTLVEILIVIMIIAILAGMLLLATGMSLDSTEAAKVIGDLRNLKSAAMLYYSDNLKWPTNTEVESLDIYADRPICAADPPRYAYVSIGTPYLDAAGQERVNMGIGLFADGNGSPGIQKKLAARAGDVGILGSAFDASALYTGGADVFINLK